MWPTLLKAGMELGRRGRGGRMICPVLGLAAAGAVSLGMAWKARQSPAQPSKPRPREEAPPPQQ